MKTAKLAVVLIMVVLLSTAVLFSAVGCKQPISPEPAPAQHEHAYGAAQWSGVVTWGNWATVTESTETTSGLGKRTGTEKGVKYCTANDGATEETTRQREETREIPAGFVLVPGADWHVTERTQNVDPNDQTQHEHTFVWVNVPNVGIRWETDPDDPTKEIGKVLQQHRCSVDFTLDSEHPEQWVFIDEEIYRRDKVATHEDGEHTYDETNIPWDTIPTVWGSGYWYINDSTGKAERTGKKTATVNCTANDGGVKTVVQDVTEARSVPEGQQLKNNVPMTDDAPFELIDTIPPVITLPNIGSNGVNVDFQAIIAECTTYGGGVHTISPYYLGTAFDGSIENDNYRIMKQLSQQAKYLQNFFDGVRIDGAAPASNSKFGQLKDLENGLRNKPTGTPAGFLEYMETQKSAILNKIFEGSDAAARDKFNQYAEAYGNYYNNYLRDWGTTAGTGSVITQRSEDAGAEYYNLVNGVRTTYPADIIPELLLYPPHDLNGVTVQYAPYNAEQVQNALKAAMKQQIAAALGITADDNADKLTDALVIQLCQDHEEFKAFITDLQNEAENYQQQYLPPVLNQVYNGQAVALEQEGQSQTQRLASVNAQFAPDMLKTAYGKPFEQYTGNFTPYKKNDMAV